MKNFKIFLFLTLFIFSICRAEVLHYHFTNPEKSSTFIWEKNNLKEFTELILSWNAKRPIKGSFSLLLSLKTEKGWSPFVKYAVWSANDQKSFKQDLEDFNIFLRQDILATNTYATGFKVKLIAKKEASLSSFRALHTFIKTKENPIETFFQIYTNIDLPVPLFSQFELNTPHKERLCSPTSTSAVISYLSPNLDIDPLIFASKVWDSNFDIYGNWVLNIAQASDMLGSSWDCWVERFSKKHDLLKRLLNKTPVVISIRGPLKGSALPYKTGHLIAVTGYDSLTDEFICMDPAFFKSSTKVRYAAAELQQAWERRGNIAYIFSKRNTDLVDIHQINPRIQIDLKYATEDNFTNTIVYDFNTCYLLKKIAQKLSLVQEELEQMGLGLKVWDGYRPSYAQHKFWQLVPDERYVANPNKRSRHNRGTTIDLTLISLKDGKELEMPTVFDDFTKKAHRDNVLASPQAIKNRELLQTVMENHGFKGLSTEWWHFDYKDWENFKPLDVDPKDLY